MTYSANDESEAARWAIRLDSRPLDDAEQRALDTWLAADERRKGALLRAEATLAYLDRGRALAEPELDFGNEHDASHWSRRKLLVGGGSIAGLAVAATSGFLLWRPAPIEIRTALGEIRRVPLPDGSVASVNTASDVEVALEDKQRKVKIKDGEAWFQVAHDKSRPFVVEAGEVRVQAVGTAFSVRRREDGADVLVTEGVVEVWVAGQEGRRARIAAGSQSFVAGSPRPIEVAPAAGTIDRALAWRTGELALDGESLEYAVAELNRYNARKLVIDDPALGQETLVGYFRVDQPENFGRAVGATIGAKVLIEGDTIHLTR